MFYSDIMKESNVPLFARKEGFEKLFRQVHNNGEKYATVQQAYVSRTLCLENFVEAKSDCDDNEYEQKRLYILILLANKIKSMTYEEYVNNLDNVRIEGIGVPLDKLKTRELFNKLQNLKEEEVANFNEIKDADIRAILDSTYISCCDLINEHNGRLNNIWFVPKNNLNYDKRPMALTRIYLNAPKFGANPGKIRDDFLVLFIKKCIERNLPYEMKGYGAGSSTNDNMLFYVKTESLKEYTDILDEIAKENRELVASFGSPVATAHNIDSLYKDKDGKVVAQPYYAVCQEPSIYEFQKSNGVRERRISTKTYNDYVEILARKAYFNVVSKNLLSSIDEYKSQIIELRDANFIEILKKYASDNYDKTLDTPTNNENSNLITIRSVFEKKLKLQKAKGDIGNFETKIVEEFKEKFIKDQKSLGIIGLKFNPGAEKYIVSSAFSADGVADTFSDDGKVLTRKDQKENNFPLGADKNIEKLAEQEDNLTREVMSEFEKFKLNYSNWADRILKKHVEKFGVDKVLLGLEHASQIYRESQKQGIESPYDVQVIGRAATIIVKMRKERSEKLFNNYSSAENKQNFVAGLTLSEKEDLAKKMDISVEKLNGTVPFDAKKISAMASVNGGPASEQNFE